MQQQEFDRIFSTVFYALGNDLSYRDFHDLESAIKLQPFLVVQVTNGAWFNYEFNNSLIRLNFFNMLGHEIFHLEEMKWKMISLEINDIPEWPPYRTTEFYAKIVDPSGNVYPKKNYGEGLMGFIKCVKILRDMSRFECIEHYEIALKNKEMKVQIEQLEKNIELLKNLNNKI